MNPYCIIPICLIGPGGDSEQTTEVDPNNDKVVKGRVQPINIDIYVPGFYWGAMVYMKSGKSFMTTLTCEQIDQMLANYWNRVEKKENDKPTIVTLQ